MNKIRFLKNVKERLEAQELITEPLLLETSIHSHNKEKKIIK